jgi:hypothetical protein
MSMPSFSKSPPELVARFDAFAAELPDVERRQMFGYPALFVGGNLVSGLFQAGWFVRLPPAGQADLLAVPGSARFEPAPGRTMGGYVVMAPAIVADDAALRGWLDRAIEFGRTLPPKAAKPTKAAKPRSSRPG